MTRNMKITQFATASLSIVAGLSFILAPQIIGAIIGMLFGFFLLLRGSFSIAGYVIARKSGAMHDYNLFIGVLLMAAGLVFVFNPNAFLSIFTWLFGVFFIIDGSLELYSCVPYKAVNMAGWWFCIIGATLLVLAGIFMIAYPFSGTNTIIIVCGVILLLSGVQNFVAQLVAPKYRV